MLVGEVGYGGLSSNKCCERLKNKEDARPAPTFFLDVGVHVTNNKGEKLSQENQEEGADAVPEEEAGIPVVVDVSKRKSKMIAKIRL